MAKHSSSPRHARNWIPRTSGHRQAPQGVRTHHCHYEPEPMPWLLYGEAFEDICEALDYNPDDDDDDGGHRRPAKIS